MSTKVSHGLKQMGANKGDVLAMFLPNCMEYPVVFGAATDAGKDSNINELCSNNTVPAPFLSAFTNVLSHFFGLDFI